MIASRWAIVSAIRVTIMPPLPGRAKAPTSRSISPASRTPSGLSSTPKEGATPWIAANCASPDGLLDSRRTATRRTPGAISLSISSHLTLSPNSADMKPVALPPGRARLCTMPMPTGHGHEDDRHASGRLLQRHRWRRPVGHDDVGRERDQFGRVPADAIVIDAPARVDLQVAAFVPAELAQRLLECREASYGIWIVIHRTDEHADPPYPVRLLRARRERPCNRAAEHRDERAPPHSITSSARSRIDVDTSMPSALAVLRLTIVPNLVDRSTGRSLGFAPFRILSTNVAARRNMSRKLIP